MPKPKYSLKIVKAINPIYSKIAKDNYKAWGFDNPQQAYNMVANDKTYDYLGYYSSNPYSDANANTHWPDTYKTAYHPTFSDESIYSGVRHPKFNPYGQVGGHWYGNFYARPNYTWQRIKLK